MAETLLIYFHTERVPKPYKVKISLTIPPPINPQLVFNAHSILQCESIITSQTLPCPLVVASTFILHLCTFTILNVKSIGTFQTFMALVSETVGIKGRIIS